MFAIVSRIEALSSVIEADGSSQYLSLGDVVASTQWQQAQATFVTPANAQRLTVFHILSAVGTLQTDAYLLTETTALQVTDHVPNNSLEQPSDADPTMPAGWQTDHWGTNTAIFQYLPSGHTGTHSVKAEITTYMRSRRIPMGMPSGITRLNQWIRRLSIPFRIITRRRRRAG